MVTDLNKPDPPIDKWNAEFWHACREKRLIAQRCRETGKVWLPPSPISPHTRRRDWDWVELSGSGRIWSYIVMHHCYFQSFAAEIPYNVVQIELDEGPHLLSNLIGVEPSGIGVGLRVQVTFDTISSSMTIPKFVLAE